MEDRFENFEAALPLSPEQRAVLAMHRGASLPPLAVAAAIEGPVDEARLRAVAAGVLQAHEALRLALREAADPLAWRQQPRATLPASHAQADAPMQPHEGAMVRIALEGSGASQHRLVLSAHPLAADATSLAGLVARIAEAYGEAHGKLGAADAEPAEPFQYTQFAAWRDALAHDDEEDAVKGRAYWAGYLAGETPAAPRLAFRQGDSTPAASTRRVVVERPLDARLSARLDELARSQGVQPAELLQAAWWALLARLTGFARFAGGWQHDCRRDYEVMQGAVGVYEKVLPVRVEIDGAQPFADWLARFAAQVRSHVEAQEYGGLDVSADAAHLAVGFALHVPPELPAAWQLAQRPGPLPCFELALEAEWSARRAVLALHADESRHAPPALQRLLQQLVAMLQAVVDNPATPLQDLALVDASERQALLSLQGPLLEVGEQGIAERIAHWARTTPDAPAIEDGDQGLSYAALDARANRMARWMQSKGVQRGSLVALALPRSLDLLVAMLAAWRAGAGYLPLEPEWPAARRAAVLADAQPALLLQAGPVQDEPAPGASPWRVATTAGGIDLAAFEASAPEVTAGPQDLAYVLYTSGSTGKPKGVVIEQAQLLNYVAAASSAMQLEGCQRWALTSTVAADLGNTALFGAFFNGACLVVAGAEATNDAAAFTRFMAERRIDALKIVPSHLEALLEAEAPVLPKLLVLGGEAASRSLLERIARVAPECTVYNHYGPTETTVGVMVHRLEPGAAFPGQLPLSRVLANNRVRVLDHALRLAPTGALGELYIGGAQLCRGYLGGVAQEAFIDDPFAAGERLYRTGDLACVLPDGAVRIAGRADHQLKVRGFRVEPGEIEAVLLAQEGVRQAAVLPVAMPAGGVELVACVSCAGAQGLAAGLRERLAALLPAHMVPARCVEIETFPRLANGKVDRLALAAALPAASRDGAQEGAQAPRDALEQLLAAGMAELLGRESIGADEDFFELGAHSLLVIKLAARIRRLLRVEIAPGVVFDHPSVTTLARAVRAASTDLAQTEQLADAWRLEAEAASS